MANDTTNIGVGIKDIGDNQDSSMYEVVYDHVLNKFIQRVKQPAAAPKQNTNEEGQIVMTVSKEGFA